MNDFELKRSRLVGVALVGLFLVWGLVVTPNVFSQEGRLVREKVHSDSLERTATKESPDRDVTIYLPPSYDTSPTKRYPVVYLLHGITDTDETWIRDWTKTNDPWETVQRVMNNGIAEQRFGEMIIVMPNQLTNWGGSFYTNSAVTGNWEDFTVKDLLSHVDGKYRTLAQASSRGIAGHSMGGYGAIKLGMKHPDVYSVVYGLNPAVLGWGGELTIENPAFTSILKATTAEEVRSGHFYQQAIVVLAQAFSPNPERPPFFADFPFALVEGTLRPAEPAFTQWQENFPIHMIETYQSNLSKLRGLKFDSGYEDEFAHIPITARALSAKLTALGIEHIFEEYNGDHRNRLWTRTGRMATEVMPFFWILLDSQDPQ